MAQRMTRPARDTGNPDRPVRWLIATDLDGTLLDDGYDLPAAAAALDDQAEQGRRVVVASSKTFDEMLALARFCAHPPVLIFENGAGVAWPLQARAVPGEPPRYRSRIEGEGYSVLRAQLRCMRRRSGYRFLGFGDLSAREVASHTGLSQDAARLARHRAATEPVMWLDDQRRLGRFVREVGDAGFRVQAGGRFLHVMPHTDKARALRQVVEHLRQEHGQAWRVVACGDADNDLAMLEAADHAVVFPRRDGSYLTVRNRAGSDVGLHIAAAGPTCWSAALDQLAGSGCGNAARRPEVSR